MVMWGNFTFHNKERSTLLRLCRVQLARSSLMLIRKGKFWDKKVAWWNGTHFRPTTRVFVSHDSRSKSTKGTRHQNCNGDRNIRDSVPLRVRQITAPSSVGACHYITHTHTDWRTESTVHCPTYGESDIPGHDQQKLLPLIKPEPL